jgi:hypothetical protein
MLLLYPGELYRLLGASSYYIRQSLKLYQFRELSENLIEQRKLTFSMKKMAVFTQAVIIPSLMYED